MPTTADPAALDRLHALIVEALTASDALGLDAVGIALDTARVRVANAISARRPDDTGGPPRR